MKGAVEILTLGCRLNTFESAAMQHAAREAGRENIIIVNTCAVTNEAVKQARQAIRKLKREKPDRHIIVTGCAAQVEPETFAAMPEVAEIIGNDIKLEPQAWHVSPSFGVETERVRVNDIMAIRETAPQLIEGIEGHARAFVQVQNGCDHRCTFCIIPYGRGNSRSVPMGEVVRQVEALVEKGYSEMVLTGVDITSYGPDLPGSPSLGALIRAILTHVPGVRRLRLSSIDSIEADAMLIDLLKNEQRLMPHLHLSLQSGDDMILKRMKRRHNRADAIRFCDTLRAARPDFVFGADFIAGFPTETDAMFENTLRLVEECGLTFLHVFPFSPRPGTPAAKMPPVHGATIKARAARLRQAGETALHHHLNRHIGQIGEALIERNNIARLPDFTPIRFEGEAEPGRLAQFRITGQDGTRLIGEKLPESEGGLSEGGLHG